MTQDTEFTRGDTVTAYNGTNQFVVVGPMAEPNQGRIVVKSLLTGEVHLFWETDLILAKPPSYSIHMDLVVKEGTSWETVLSAISSGLTPASKELKVTEAEWEIVKSNISGKMVSARLDQ